MVKKIWNRIRDITSYIRHNVGRVHPRREPELVAVAGEYLIEIWYKGEKFLYINAHGDGDLSVHTARWGASKIQYTGY